MLTKVRIYFKKIISPCFFYKIKTPQYLMPIFVYISKKNV